MVIKVNPGQSEDLLSWGNVWDMAEQITELCVRGGKWGYYERLGGFRNGFFPVRHMIAFFLSFPSFSFPSLPFPFLFFLLSFRNSTPPSHLPQNPFSHFSTELTITNP